MAFLRMRKPTHEKIPYGASCVQWDGDNHVALLDMVDNACLSGPYHIVIRHKFGISTMRIGDWLRVGSDGSIKIITPEVFAVRYRAISLQCVPLL